MGGFPLFMKKYEFIEHTADIAIKAYGDTLEEAFAAAAEAMFDIITAGSEIEADKNISFAVESIDLEGLLVYFLSPVKTGSWRPPRVIYMMKKNTAPVTTSRVYRII